jgi:uncharacterized repeat protein (TIGR01451 family)
MNHRSLSLRQIWLTALMLIGLLANNISIANATHVSGPIDTDTPRTLAVQQRQPFATGTPSLSTLEGLGAENNPPDSVTPPFSPTLDFPPAFRPTRPFTIPAAYSGTFPMPPRSAPDIQPPMFDNWLAYTEIQAATGISVCGSLAVNTVWTTANSPYRVTCDVGVPAGVMLTIQAGVTVQFQHAGDDLIVSGTLKAIGTGSAPIRFQPLSGTTPGSWGRVAFLTGSSGVLNHAILEYGGSSGGLVYIASDAVQVLNSVVRHSADTGIVIQTASPLISATQILTNTGYNYGGGLSNDSGSPTIQNNTFTGNSAYHDYCYEDMEGYLVCDYYGHGGGVYNDSGSPLIQDNTFTGNLAGDNGGGVYNNSGSPTIQNNTFIGNRAYSDGGGVYNDYGSPTIQDNTFTGNLVGIYSYGHGGGLSNDSGSPLIQDNTFTGNSAGDNGGGLSNGSGSPTIQNNTFTSNSARYGGGGISNGFGSPTIQNNTFTGNSADGGGGLSNNYGSPTIQNNTFTGNSASYGGGGVYNYSGRPTIHSNIIANSSGSGIYNSGGVPALDYNDVWNNSGGNYSGVTPGVHDISADPLFVDAAHGNYHLTFGSPCIDAADPDNHIEADFDGEPRPMGLAPDIGADEYRALGIAMTGVPVKGSLGRLITYTATLINLTAVTLTNVRITDTLPVEAAFTGYQAAGLTCGHTGSTWGGQLTCTLSSASLSPGSRRALTVTAITTDTLLASQYVTNHIAATGRADGVTFAAHDQVRTLFPLRLFLPVVRRS